MNQFKNIFYNIGTLCILIMCSLNLVPHSIFVVILFMFALKCFYLKSRLKSCERVHKESLFSQREDFINTLSHDLRIPLIAQLRAIELLNNESLGMLKNEQKEMLMQIQNSCQSTLSLISLIINIYNLENDVFELIREKFNITGMIVDCFNELSQEAKEKNITFEYFSKNRDLFVYADKHEIKKVITNLLSSAIIYSSFGGKITVDMKLINNKINFRIFCSENKICSFNTNIDAKYTTIGQNIRMEFCKKIIEVHNGSIVDNNIPNSFGFELPKVGAEQV